MINKDLVMINSDVKTQSEVLQIISQKAYHLHLLTDSQEFIDSVLKREEEYSTAIGLGVAIPHGMSHSVQEAFIAFLKPTETIKWGKEETEVDLIFLIGVPLDKKDKLHLKIISQISKCLMKEDFRNKLRSCQNSEEGFNYLDKINKNIEEEIKCS